MGGTRVGAEEIKSIGVGVWVATGINGPAIGVGVVGAGAIVGMATGGISRWLDGDGIGAGVAIGIVVGDAGSMGSAVALGGCAVIFTVGAFVVGGNVSVELNGACDGCGICGAPDEGVGVGSTVESITQGASSLSLQSSFASVMSPMQQSVA